ncbi:MAG: hypothetical protein HYZ81_26245 [Nitrospinae bacterium]|nr:hypothetical protein [Nitrospinota bacterium]
MKRIVSTVLVVTFLSLAGVFSVAPVPLESVAYAQASDKAIMDQLTKIKAMVADVEMKVQSKKMAMDAMGMEKTMKMLMDVTKMLEDLHRTTP